MQTSGCQTSNFEENWPNAVATMSPFKAGPTFKSMVSWLCATTWEESLLKNLIENHASVFLKFLEFLEDAPIPPKTPNKILHYCFGIWGPCVRYNSICLVSRINYPAGKTGTKILCHSSKDPSLGIPCSDQSLRHLCNHML